MHHGVDHLNTIWAAGVSNFIKRQIRVWQNECPIANSFKINRVNPSCKYQFISRLFNEALVISGGPTSANPVTRIAIKSMTIAASDITVSSFNKTLRCIMNRTLLVAKNWMLYLH